jgi:hypothetical protein
MSAVVRPPEAPARPTVPPPASAARPQSTKPQPATSPRRLFALVRPEEGWVAFIGFAAAAVAMASSIAKGNWQPGLSGLP